jgi:hypothetical protein
MTFDELVEQVKVLIPNAYVALEYNDDPQGIGYYYPAVVICTGLECITDDGDTLEEWFDYAAVDRKVMRAEQGWCE